jgi:hypothetical protein
MSYTAEKIFFGLAVLLSSAFSTLGAILTDGETRWIMVTFTSSILTAAFLSLVFKRVDETIRHVVGRSGLAILGGMLGSRYLVHRYGISFVDGDVVGLAGLAAAVTLVGWLIGYWLLVIANANGKKIADKLFKRWMGDQ